MRHERRNVDSCEGSWTTEDGQELLVLSPRGPESARIEVVRLEAGGRLGPYTDGAVEVLVLSGTWSAPGGDLGVGGFCRHAGLDAAANHTAEGCELLVRRLPRGGDAVHAPNVTEAWVPGHGNLEVRPLHAYGGVSCALVRWPAGERFVAHRHFGGEEIFVLSGVFEDEHGRYPAGTWLLSPHLSEHTPFVREETLIFVRTGHWPPGDEENR